MPEPMNVEPSELDRPVRPRELPLEAVVARQTRLAYDERNEPVARPRIEANLAAVKIVLARLEVLHARVADRSDLDLLGYTRPSAIWLLTGRCLGLLRALVVQVEAGICGPAVVTQRALHEAGMLLQAVTDPGSDELLRRWLDDPDDPNEYVRPWQARQQVARFEERVNTWAKENGLGELGKSPSSLARGLYDDLSRAGHNRRAWCADEVFEPAREMAYGVHPSPIRRAAYTSVAVEMTKEVTRFVGYSLSRLLGQKFWREEIEPLLASLKAAAAPVATTAA